MGFSDDINRFVKKTAPKPNKLVKNVVHKVAAKLILMTPVGDADFWQSKPPAGYLGGHARFNWTYSMGTRVKQELTGIDQSPGGAATYQRLVESMPVNMGDNVHYIQNSVPYILRLEDGYSRQAPNGMAAVTAAEFQGIVSEEVSKL